MATALSCVVDEVPCVHYEMLRLGGTVPVAPYATFGTPELAEARARRARGPDRGADGQPRRDRATAPTSPAADGLTRLLEWACTVYWRAARSARRGRSTRTRAQAVVDAVVARGYGTDEEGAE